MTNITEIATKHIQKITEHITIPVAITFSVSDRNDAHISVKGIKAKPMFADCVLRIKTADVCK